MGYIDAHSHVWSQEFSRYPILPQYDPQAIQPPTFTPEELLTQCSPCGVDRVVLIQMSYYGCDNSYMTDAIALQPEMFRGVAVIDHTADAATAEMARLRSLGVRGFRIQPGAEGPAGWLGDRTYQRMLAAAGDLGMAICPLIDPEYLPGIARAATAHPNTAFVIDHLARIGIGGAVQQDRLDDLCALAQCPNCFVKVSAFYALGSRTAPYGDLGDMIRQVRDAFGADRLMWATDCPYQVVHGTYEDSIALIRDRLPFLGPEERKQMLEGTAQRVFFGD